MGTKKATQEDHENRDPITGTPGAHPVGTGIGAVAGGAAAGAASGIVAGPIGTVVGAAVGAVAGGLAGKRVARLLDPGTENDFWRANFSTRPYVQPGASFSDYGPAYAYGLESWGRNPGSQFDEIEANLAQDWEGSRGTSTLRWERARHAVRDAWDRASDIVEKALPGDADKDGH
jgi:hypothetical protein